MQIFSQENICTHHINIMRNYAVNWVLNFFVCMGAVYRLECADCRLQITVYSVQISMCRMQCVMCRLRQYILQIEAAYCTAARTGTAAAAFMSEVT